MQYHVAQNGEKIGPLEKEEVLRRLVAGALKPTDLGWHEGLAEWEPLSKLIPPQAASTGSGVFAPASAHVLAQPAQTSGKAIASMVCGLLGLLLWLPCIPAIILGHMGLSAIKKSGGALKGSGMAITGLITGYLMVALIPVIAILASLAVPAFNQVQTQGNQMKAVMNAKQIVMGMKMYAADHSGHYPPTIETLFEEQILTDRRILEFPKTMNVPGQGWDYRGAEFTDADPGNVILLMSKKADSSKKKIVARNDGSAEAVRESQLR